MSLRPALAAFVTAAVLLFPARATEKIEVEGVIDAPVAAVWRAWTTTEGLVAWLAPAADIDLRIGGLMRTRYTAGPLGDDQTISNRILAFDPERMLCIRVATPPKGFPFAAKVETMWTVLAFAPTADGRTTLRVTGLGFEADALSQKMKAFFAEGNAYTLEQLKQHFARKPAAAPR